MKVQVGDFMNKDFWKKVFAILKENGEINLSVNLHQQVDGNSMMIDHAKSVNETISSLMKLNGFTNIHISEHIIQAKKPQWQAAGAPLKRKNQ